MTAVRALAIPLLVFISVVLVFIGIQQQGDGSLNYWSNEALKGGVNWLILSVSVAGILSFFRVKNRSLFSIFITVFYLGTGVGWGASFSVFYFFVSTYFSGRILLYALYPMERKEVLLYESLIVGVGVYLCVFGILMHFPLNYRSIYIAVLAVPIVIAICIQLPVGFRERIQLLLVEQHHKIREIAYWKLCLALIVIGWVAHYAFLPTVGYDDNAMHLRIWTVLSDRQVYDFDVTSQVWAASPFSVDLLHAIVSLLAQSDARGALNLAFLSVLICALWGAMDVFNRNATDRLLIVVLFVTTPMLAHLLATLQTELFMAVLAMVGTRVSLQRGRPFFSSSTATIIIVMALCLATKLPGAVLGLSLALAYSINLFGKNGSRKEMSWRDAGGIILVFLLAGFVALHSYVVAWVYTRNPFFPLYNGYFKSPLFGAHNFLDMRYVTGANIESYLGFFFNTGKYFESANFVAGFQYLVLLPLGIGIVICLRRYREIWIILWPLLGFGLTMFSIVQYWRYLFPVLPLASLLISGVFLGRINDSSCFPSKSLTRGLLSLYAVVNVFFLPGISWIFSASPDRAFDEGGRRGLVAQFTPEQLINERLNQEAPGAKVLFDPSRPYGATLAVSPTYVNWYAPDKQVKVASWQNIQDVASFLDEENIQFVYWNLAATADFKDTYRTLLREYLARFGRPIYQVGAIVVYYLKSTEVNYRDSFNYQMDKAEANSRTGARSQITERQLVAGNEALLIAELRLDKESFSRYSVRLKCPDQGSVFVAQINWNNAPAYYRLVQCNRKVLEFMESLSIPVGAKRGSVYVSTYGGGAEISVEKIKIELDY